jgi:A/G-specific adenine glycosylase
VAYVLTRGGEVALVRRPPSGLLGGMLALPTGDWAETSAPADGVPAPAEWRSAGQIEHVFTHFSLTLQVMRAEGDSDGLIWMDAGAAAQALPTVFRKALRAGLTSLL